MKTKQEILKDLFATLAEIEYSQKHNNKTEDLEKYLKIRLEILYDVLGEDVPEEYWERIENIIYS